MLDRLAKNIADYAIFQIEAGAQVIQVNLPHFIHHTDVLRLLRDYYILICLFA